MNRNSKILKTFTIYRSSAGSGKTRTLAKEYLKLALQNKAYYFRHILAVTFANKATQEMKDRILDYLSTFASGAEDDLSAELMLELKQDKPTFIQNCSELRSEILHHYDLFSISTIDSFFQKVIRSFTRESGLIGDYRLEDDDEAVLEEVINNLIDELGENPDLTHWVVEFAKENLENDRAWDVRTSLKEFSREITNESFKNIEAEIQKDTVDPQFFKKLRDELWKVKKYFLDAVSKPAIEILQIIESRGWDYDDFKGKSKSGLKGFLEQFAYNKTLSTYKNPGVTVRSEFTFAKNWPQKSAVNQNEIIQTAEQSLVPSLVQIISHYDNHYQEALSAEVVLKNMYVFGLISDISRKLKEYKRENNLMLLSDASKFLNGIIQDSDTPFIYEKIGSFYRHYLIDEFQDTSGFQWNNFLPLLTNGLDQGYRSLVVGDVKQAVYRWRGGDLRLLQQNVEELLGKNRVEVKELDRNFRSGTNIIQFNNALFTSLSALISAKTNSQLPASAYQDIVQETSKKSEGFVHISFLNNEEETSWEDQALKNIPHQLETLQRRGVAIRDIAILVRKNGEGQQIADYLLQYKESSQALADCKYDVVSNESLRMTGAASVNLLLGALRYLLNTEDDIARAQLSFEYARLHKPKRSQTEVFAVTNQVFFERQLPDQFTREKMSLKKLPLFELTETLISIFKLSKEKGELPYLLAFQDRVLDFYSRERNDIGSFLEWWEDNKNKEKTSIKISSEVDAIKVLTIHKAKGLQFKYVLIPFCSWEMDHKPFQSPNLWVKSNEKPFAAAGNLPVKYSSSLDETYFQNYYQEEKTATYLDNLNLLYVALTRAEEGMIVTAPFKQNGTVAEWLLKSVSEGEALNSNWNAASQEFVMGDWHKAIPGERKDLSNTIPLNEYYSSRWRDNLVIRQTGITFFEEKKTDQRIKINYGIHLHTVLSRIRHADEVPKAIERLLQEGMISEGEKPGIRSQLEKLMSHPVVGSWFTADWQVKTEVPILLPGGLENRIDRLMIRDGKAIVVDFKTGEKTKADQKQVMEYMDILRKMNFKTVEGYLLYTRDQEVISLQDGKQKVLKKKDESQLGLGFDA